MFSPKKLGIIGLLLLNTIEFVQSIELTNCSVFEGFTLSSENTENEPVQYCISESQIYGIDANNACTGSLEDGFYVFSVDSESNITSKVSSDSIVADDSALVMYQCHTGDANQVCKKSYGYAEINSQYYEIGYTSQSVDMGGDSMSCEDTSLYGTLIQEKNNGPSLCVNGANDVYQLYDVTFRIVGNTKFVKYYGFYEYRNETFVDYSDFSGSLSGASVFNVEVNKDDPPSENSRFEFIHVGDWYLMVDPTYQRTDNVYVTEVLVGVSAEFAQNYEESPSVMYENKLITFPKSLYYNGDYLLKFRMTNQVREGPFKALVNTLEKPKHVEAGYVVSVQAVDNEKGTPAVMAFNHFYSKINYCLDDGLNELVSRRMNICNGKFTCDYYYCQNGICKPSTSTRPTETSNICNPLDSDLMMNCDDGYYLVDNGLVNTVGAHGSLYQCKDGYCYPITIDGYTKVGYYKNADTQNNSAIPVIKCYEPYNEIYYSPQCIAMGQPEENATCINVGDLVMVGREGEDSTPEIGICLKGKRSKETITFTTDDEATPIVKVAHYSIFGIYGSDERYIKIILTANSSSITIVNGNYLLNNSNDEILTNPYEAGSVFQCVNGFQCYNINEIGYYYNQMKNIIPTTSPYIRCNRYFCELYDIVKTSCSTPLEDDTTIASSGELFITQSRDNRGNTYDIYNICLDLTGDVPIFYPLGNSKTSESNDYDSSVDSYELLISTNNINGIFPYNPDKYVLGYIVDKDIRLEYRDTIFQLADTNNRVYRKYRMNEDNCPDLDSIVEFEILCPLDSGYTNEYSYYQKYTE